MRDGGGAEQPALLPADPGHAPNNRKPTAITAGRPCPIGGAGTTDTPTKSTSEGGVPARSTTPISDRGVVRSVAFGCGTNLVARC